MIYCSSIIIYKLLTNANITLTIYILKFVELSDSQCYFNVLFYSKTHRINRAYEFKHQQKMVNIMGYIEVYSQHHNNKLNKIWRVKTK